jgi:hypothetical protein
LWKRKKKNNLKRKKRKKGQNKIPDNKRIDTKKKKVILPLVKNAKRQGSTNICHLSTS